MGRIKINKESYRFMHEMYNTCAPSKNYKRFYSEMLGIKWDSKKYDIHHLDGNRNNNCLENLVLIPKRLHHIFHFYVKSEQEARQILCIGYYFYRKEWDKQIQNLIIAKIAIRTFIDIRDNIIGLYFYENYGVTPQELWEAQSDADNVYSKTSFLYGL